MTRKKSKNLYGYKHIKRTPRKRRGRHAKNRGKRLSKIKKYRGQGR